MRIKNKEIAALIGKTPSAVSYVKRHNPSEFEIMRLGTAVKILKLTLEDIEKMHALKEQIRRAA